VGEHVRVLLTGTALIIATFLAVSLRVRLAYLGSAVLGLTVLLLGVATVSFYVPVVPLMPALQSGWLVIHVLVALLATAFFGLAFLVSLTYLLTTRRRGLPPGSPGCGTVCPGRRIWTDSHTG
jgi:ABC-type transport system involved in cytochrome c biogenesis permease subunit